MRQAISRARSKVYEYALCNPWDYFITLTIDKNSMARDQLATYQKALAYFIKRLNAHRKNRIIILLVPELHADKKSWHMHGLIAGLTAHDLTTNANGYLDWMEYSARFGFCSLSPIRNSEAVSKYILKYVGKGFNDRQVGEHLYYCSRGLQVAKTVKVGFLAKIPEEWDYENDYCKVLWCNETAVAFVK